MTFLFNDGGREAAGYRGTAGDCGARAMAIALGIPYQEAYDELAQANKDSGQPKSARNGIQKAVLDKVLQAHGWAWHQAPKFEGRKARCYDLGCGTVIARQAHHFVAVVDGTPHDTFDCTRKMVYGFWAEE